MYVKTTSPSERVVDICEMMGVIDTEDEEEVGISEEVGMSGCDCEDVEAGVMKREELEMSGRRETLEDGIAVETEDDDGTDEDEDECELDEMLGEDEERVEVSEVGHGAKRVLVGSRLVICIMVVKGTCIVLSPPAVLEN